MKISPFLAVVTFCCLLFMEYDPDEQKAYNKLGLDLGELCDNLSKLQNSISAQNATTKETIDTIISEVRSARESLGNKNEPIIKKDISIAQPLEKVKKAITEFSTKYSSDKLNEIEQTWREQIQKTFLEAMK